MKTNTKSNWKMTITIVFLIIIYGFVLGYGLSFLK